MEFAQGPVLLELLKHIGPGLKALRLSKSRSMLVDERAREAVRLCSRAMIDSYVHLNDDDVFQMLGWRLRKVVTVGFVAWLPDIDEKLERVGVSGKTLAKLEEVDIRLCDERMLRIFFEAVYDPETSPPQNSMPNEANCRLYRRHFQHPCGRGQHARSNDVPQHKGHCV